MTSYLYQGKNDLGLTCQNSGIRISNFNIMKATNEKNTKLKEEPSNRDTQRERRRSFPRGCDLMYSCKCPLNQPVKVFSLAAIFIDYEPRESKSVNSRVQVESQRHRGE